MGIFENVEEPNNQGNNKKEMDKAAKEALEKERRDFLSEKINEIKYTFRPDQELPENVQGKTIYETIGEERSERLLNYLLQNQEVVILVDELLDESKEPDEKAEKSLVFLIKDASIKIRTGRLEEERFEKAA